MKKSRRAKADPTMGLLIQPPRLRGWHLSPLAVTAVGGLLSCLGLWGAAACVVTAFALPVPHWFLLLFCFLFSLLFCAVFSMRRGCTFLTVVLMVGWLATLWLLREPAFQGFVHSTNQIFQLFARQTSWIFPQYLADASSPTLISRNISLFVALILFPWSGLLAWCVCRQGRFLLPFLLTAPLISVHLWFYLEPALLPLLALLLFWISLLVGQQRPGEAVGMSARTALLCLPALTLALLLVYAAAPRDGYVRPAGIESARLSAEAYVSTLPAKLADFLTGNGGPANGFLTYDRQRRSFLGLGNASFTGRTDLRVKVPEEEGNALYLKGFTGAVYDSTGWSVLPDAAQAKLIAAAAPIPPQNLRFSAASYLMTSRTLEVENLVNPRMIYVPPILASTPDDLPNIQFSGDSDLRASGLLGLDTYTLDYAGWGSSSSDAALPVPDKSHLDARQLEQAYLQASRNYYRQVPSALRPVLEQILNDELSTFYDMQTGEVIRHGNPERQSTVDRSIVNFAYATDVAYFLQNNGGFQYTLSPGTTPSGRDLTEYFLTESRRGYCVYFATAGTLLLRELGVPARYCEGYLATPGDLANREEDGFSNLPDRRSHAWVEYYVPDFGWQVLECTPGFTAGGTEVQPNDQTNEIAPMPRPTATPTPSPTPTPTPTPAATPAPTPGATPAPTDRDPMGPDWSPLLTLLKLPSLCISVVIIVWGRRAVVLRLRRRTFTQADRNRAALGAYHLLERLSPWAGPPEEGLTTLAEKARFSRSGLEAAELDIMLAGLTQAQTRALADGNPLTRLMLRYGYCLC